MTRACRRCGENETRTEHDWGEPAYVASNTCEQVRPCSRCATQLSAGTMHVWTAWTYGEDGSCAQTLGCSRCGAAGTGTHAVLADSTGLILASAQGPSGRVNPLDPAAGAAALADLARTVLGAVNITRARALCCAATWACRFVTIVR